MFAEVLQAGPRGGLHLSSTESPVPERSRLHKHIFIPVANHSLVVQLRARHDVEVLEPLLVLTKVKIEWLQRKVGFEVALLEWWNGFFHVVLKKSVLKAINDAENDLLRANTNYVRGVK